MLHQFSRFRRQRHGHFFWIMKLLPVARLDKGADPGGQIGNSEPRPLQLLQHDVFELNRHGVAGAQLQAERPLEVKVTDLFVGQC